MRNYGKSWTSKWIGAWWNYDLTTGLVVSLEVKQTRGRFYGIHLGNVLLGITVCRKE